MGRAINELSDRDIDKMHKKYTLIINATMSVLK